MSARMQETKADKVTGSAGRLLHTRDIVAVVAGVLTTAAVFIGVMQYVISAVDVRFQAMDVRLHAMEERLRGDIMVIREDIARNREDIARNREGIAQNRERLVRIETIVSDMRK